MYLWRRFNLPNNTLAFKVFSKRNESFLNGEVLDIKSWLVVTSVILNKLNIDIDLNNLSGIRKKDWKDFINENIKEYFSNKIFKEGLNNKSKLYLYKYIKKFHKREKYLSNININHKLIYSWLRSGASSL